MYKIPVRVKGKAGNIRELLLTLDIKGQVRKEILSEKSSLDKAIPFRSIRDVGVHSTRKLGDFLGRWGKGES